MSDIINQLTSLNEPEPPKGWEPGLTFDGNQGQMTIQATTPPQDGDWDDLLKLHGYDPEKFYVWNDRVGQTTHVKDGEIVQIWYKVQFARRTQIQDFDFDIDIPDQPDSTTNGWLTIFVTDQHLGKGESAGGGTEEITRRWVNGVANAIAGRTFEGIHLAFGGDMIEGYVSNNGKLIAGQDIDQQAQIRLAVRLVTVTIRKALEHANEVVVAVVPGNHGETTRVQERAMRDNNDIMIVSLVQQAFDTFGESERVAFYYPPEQYGDVVYEAGGTTFCLVHGHHFRGQMNGAQKWWEGQTINGRPAAQAQVLLAGHFHNFQAANITHDRWILFGPSLETESTWIANKNGATSKPGVLAFEMRDGMPSEIGIY